MAHSCKRFFVLILTSAAALGAGAFIGRGADVADLVVRHGQILTVAGAAPRAEAVAIKDGRFVAVGSDAEIQAWVGPSTRVIDAGGRSVLPGLFESHVHPTGVVKGDLEHPFHQMASIAAIQDWVRQRVKDTPPGRWIQIPRVDITRIHEMRLPTSAELDAACASRPVVFTWQYATRIVNVLNASAMRVAGIGPDTPAMPGGRIDHDSAGQPTGRMENCSGYIAKFLHAPGVSPEQIQDGLVRLFHRYNEVGITSITDRLTDANGLHTYQALEKAGRLPVRITVTIQMMSDGSVAGTERFIRSLPFKTGDGDDWVRVGAMKIAVDGGSLYGTAYLRQPYPAKALAFYDLRDPSYRGDLRLSPQKIKNLIRTGHRLGWQMASHVTGDAGVDAVLDAVEAADADSPIAPRRYNLIHAYFADDATAQRAARLGVVLDTQPAYYYKDSDALIQTLGPGLTDRYIGLATWVRAGVKVVINSDHMMGFEPDSSLNPYDPFIAMQTAVTRLSEGGHVYGAGQKVSREEALRMMTINAAWMSFDEKRKGSIEVGKLADLTVLTGDYLACPADQIHQLRSAATVVDGKVIYERPGGT